MFIKSEKHPSPPFTRNYLTHKTLNKKVKGEGLKTLFYIYARQGKKSVFSFFWLSGFSKNPKKKNIYIRFKIYPSPFTSPPHIHHRIPNICFPGLFFGNITLSFGDIFVFFGDILLSFGDILIFFGDILLSFGVIFVLLISEIVIIRQVEEPIRYLPPQANLVTIRVKNNGLTLFNKKNN